jgi:hypothetical protein
MQVVSHLAWLLTPVLPDLLEKEKVSETHSPSMACADVQLEVSNEPAAPGLRVQLKAHTGTGRQGTETFMVEGGHWKDTARQGSLQTDTRRPISKSSFYDKRPEYILQSNKWDICGGSCPCTEQCLLSKGRKDLGLTISIRQA